MSCGSCPHKLAPLPAGLRVRESRDIAPDELLVLMDACGNEPALLDSERVEQAIENSPYIVHARNANGSLIAYLSAFSDSARAVYLADLLVHPGWRRRGLGRRLMQHLEAHFDGVPVLLDADAAAQAFFEKLGYHARPAMTAMLKTPGTAFSYAAGPVATSAGDPVTAAAPASAASTCVTSVSVTPAAPATSPEPAFAPDLALAPLPRADSAPASDNAPAPAEDEAPDAPDQGPDGLPHTPRNAGRNAARDARHIPRP